MQQKAHCHAVLSWDGIYYLKGSQATKVVMPAVFLDDLFAFCKANGLTHVWVMPDTAFDIAGEHFYQDVKEGLEVWYPRDEGKPFELPSAFSMREKGIYGQVIVHFPDRGRWNWVMKRPSDILSAVYYLEYHLGIICEWSPNHMATDLLKLIHHNDKRRNWVRESVVNLTTLPFNKAAKNLTFLQPLDKSLVGGWIHHIDKNSAFLSACQSARNGCGDPVHCQGANRAGKDFQFMPGIYNVRLDGGDPEWMTLDVLEYALKHQWEVQILESWQFPEAHGVFRKWANVLWEVRKILKEPGKDTDYQLGRDNAYHTIKELALVGVGQLAAKGYSHAFMRPNWWADIVSKAYVAMLYNIENFKQRGVTPFACYVDGLYFASHTQDVQEAIPTALARQEELGGYKHVYSIQITEAIVQASHLVGPGEFVSYLKKLSKVEGLL